MLTPTRKLINKINLRRAITNKTNIWNIVKISIFVKYFRKVKKIRKYLKKFQTSMKKIKKNFHHRGFSSLGMTIKRRKKNLLLINYKIGRSADNNLWDQKMFKIEERQSTKITKEEIVDSNSELLINTVLIILFYFFFF